MLGSEKSYDYVFIKCNTRKNILFLPETKRLNELTEIIVINKF